ncbi:GtrA family protein [Ramlibacter sp. USB13]|uniref:GtrA family protein n=1 Tax=Ramlibacter cellulosilyticus TaxID=2764187 RepID=A0A923MQ88_9BURK|nr:GtrA family protein [Ramlibacter cellulosilyticus]MBC5782881.1 GtrA family protein [Ramlibacter cellulosilyticus]
MLSAQFLRFVLAGGVAAAANYGSRFGFSLWLPYPAAITCAYLVGMTVAFLLMRQYVFSASGQPLLPQVVKFTIVNVLALLQTLVVSLVLARWALPALGVVTHAEAIAHLFGVAVPVFTSFLGHRHATFRRAAE